MAHTIYGDAYVFNKCKGCGQITSLLTETNHGVFCSECLNDIAKELGDEEFSSIMFG